MTTRTHFVYRLYDDNDHLLYVGCTKDIVARLRNHRFENSHFFHRIARIRQQGPYLRAVAFAREKQLIRELRPDFNSTIDRRRRYKEKQDWTSSRVRELCGGREPMDVEINEYLRLSRVAHREADARFPGINNSNSPHPVELVR